MNSMELTELQKRFAPKECETQIEFERLMSELQEENTKKITPYNDRINAINHDLLLADKKLHELHAHMDKMRLERMEVEQDAKDINRIFHQLKHQLIMRNPREKFIKPDNDHDV